MVTVIVGNEQRIDVTNVSVVTSQPYVSLLSADTRVKQEFDIS
jgi:hypothetical protein